MTRLDIRLLELGLVETRSKAQALIMAGEVLVDDTPVTKAGAAIKETSHIRLRNEISKYVSRGGDKLEGALLDFNIQVKDKVALDVGSSTGGFSDCLIQNGVSKVYCIDVGTNQLSLKIRTNPLVSVFENTHVKDISNITFDPPSNFCVIDVSFISLRKVIEHVSKVLAPSANILALFKPQFELQPEQIGKGGKVKDLAAASESLVNISEFISTFGFTIQGTRASVLKGRKSQNQEYFIYCTR